MTFWSEKFFFTSVQVKFNLFFSIKNITFRRSVVADDVVGMMSDIKIGCYIMTTLEVGGCINGLFLPLCLYRDVITETATIALTISGISGITLLFSFLLVYGVARQQSGPVLLYLVYKAILIFIIVLMALVANLKYLSSFQCVFGLLVITRDNYIFIIAFLYVFSTTFTVLHYNILVINNSEDINKVGMKQRNIQFINKSYNKDWSENTINHI